MFHRFQLGIFLTLLIAVFAVTTQVVSTQQPSPRPPRNIEELERLSPIREEQDTTNSTETGVILPWSKRVFQSYRDGNWEIYTSSDNGSGEVRLTTHGAVDMSPRLNRGATQITFASKRDGVYEIYSMNVDGSGVRRLTFTGSDNTYPAWSPDGSKIAFQSYRDGQAEVYVMNADGSGQTRLTTHAGYDGYPSWSPDGTKIAFNSNRSGQLFIYVMNANGSAITQLSSQSYSYNPVWSPDGRKIAYDADADNDGWQELWTMDADGTNQQIAYNPYGQVDAWAHSWSPDGRYIAYTLISFTYYQGAWYWIDAYLDAIYLQQNSTVRLSSSGVDWNPDWQTKDGVAPVSALYPLPDTSPAPVAVHWAGSDAGGAGMMGYDVQVKVGIGGDWVRWLDNTSQVMSTYPAVGGQQYAFRIRARDNAYNVNACSPTIPTTTVEALPPQTAVLPVPPFTRADVGNLTVSWSGADLGGSGISSYDLQYRFNSGPWIDWLQATDLSTSLLEITGQSGDVIGLRSRGRDQAQNLESWPLDDDTTTTLYQWGIIGQVHDNAGTPVGAASLQTSPQSINSAFSNSEGVFGGYIADASAVYSATLSKPGYGLLPFTSYPSGPDVNVHVALPPANDIIHNGSFEAESLAEDWTLYGSATPVVTDTMLHTGKQSVQFGTVRLFGDPQTLSDQASGYGLLTAIGGDNTIHALWQEAGQWTYSQQQPNGGWSAPKHLPLDTDCQIQFAALSRMQVQANGTVQLTWVAENSLSTPYDEWLCYYERSPAGVWQPLRKYHFNEFPGEGTDSRQVNFKFAPDGVLHATWMHRTADYQWRLLYARRNTNGTWSNIETIAESFGADWFKTWLYMPDLAIEPNGTVHFVWMARETVVPSANLFYRSRASDGQWSPTGQVTFYADQYNPPGFDISLDVDAYGTLHLIYELEVSSNKKPFYYMRRTAGQWSTSVGLGALGIANEVETQLDAQGNLHVTWVEDQQVRYARTNRRSLNFTEFRLTEFPVYQIKLLVDGTGKLHFFEQGWEESLYVLVDAEGNKILQKSLPNLNYLGFAVGQKGDPYLFALDWTQHNQLLCIGPARVLQDSVWAMSQVISIPADMETPLLSFFYSYNSLFVDEQNSFDILLDDGQVSRLLKQSQVVTGWQHQWFDLSPWKGRVVTLIFRLQQKQQTPNTWAFVDDVSLGTTHPDLWVSGSSTSGLPGEIIEHTLVYGNRGGAVASGAVLTYTLPAELSFISASPPPVSTSPLVWTLEDVPAKSDPVTLSVLLQISPTAVPYSTLHSTAYIQPAYTGVELETLNNYAEGQTVISRFIYLPLIAR